MSLRTKSSKILVVLAVLIGLTAVTGSPASAVPPTDSGRRLFPVPVQHSSIDTVVTVGQQFALSDPVAHVVRGWSPENADLSGTEGVLVGNGSSGLPVPGLAINSPMISPTGLAYDGRNDILYIADTGANMVVAVSGLVRDSSNAQLSIVAGTGVAGSPVFYDGYPEQPDGIDSELNGPRALAVKNNGALYIADTGNNSVYVTDGVSLYPVVGLGVAENDSECNNGQGLFVPSASGPRGLIVDGDGKLYIADTGNHRVMVHYWGEDDNCHYETIAGTGVAGAVTQGSATDSKLSAPVGIGSSFGGGLWITDEGNHQLLAVVNGQLVVVAGSGSADPIDFNSTTDPLTGSFGSISQVVFPFLLVDSTNNILARVGEATAPTKPTPLSATPGNGSASVSFTAPTDNGGRAITKYQYTTDDGSTWTDAVGTTSPVTISGLTNGTNYSVKLRAVNIIGEGDASTTAVSVTPVSPVPAGPTLCSSMSSSRFRIQACWNFLTPAQGRVTLYRANVYVSGSNTRKATCKGPSDVPTCVLGGSGSKLSPSTTYDVRVRARIKLSNHQVVWTQFSAPVQVTTLP
jgi:Fibronectin type III domain/NHL repeat